MTSRTNDSLVTSLGRGLGAGLAGVAVMTAFQRLIEMPLTGRGESFAPAELATKVLPLDRSRRRSRRVNSATHVFLGAGWGVGRGVAGRAGLRGPSAVAALFAVMWTGDVLAMATLGLDDPPWKWSRRDLVIDVVDKLVLAAAAGAAYDRLEARVGAEDGQPTATGGGRVPS